MARRNRRQLEIEKQKKERMQWITIVILSAFILLGIFRWGVVGTFLYSLQRFLFGDLYWLILLAVIVCIAMRIRERENRKGFASPVPYILFCTAVLLICSWIDIDPEMTGMHTFLDFASGAKAFFTSVPEKVGGGITGAFLYGITSKLFGRAGVILVIIVLIVIALLLAVPVDTYKSAAASLAAFFKLPEKEKKPEREEPKETPNLWKMAREHREKKQFRMIEADGNTGEVPVPEQPKQTDPERPQIRTLVNITADGPTQEIQVVSIPGKTISSKESVFINIDDLYDRADSVDMEEDYNEQEIAEYEEPPLPEPPAGEEPEPVPEPVPEPSAPVSTKRREPFKNYRIPVASRLLDEIQRSQANTENELAAAEKGELLISILRNFDIPAELVATHIGPSVTQFEIRPDPNVKVSRILSLTDNIKMQLAAKDVRIEAPIPGRNAVGVEIPNAQTTPVRMRELFREIPSPDEKTKLMFVVGKDLLGRTVTCRLNKMPHLLIAGATGSGKSVCMNSIITSLLLRTKPDEVKLLLVDPKKVEFTPYHDIPHLIGPVINDPAKASNALKIIVQMMDERYNMFASCGVRNIEVYNEMVRKQGGRPNEDGSPAPKPMPYIVVIIDELADLMAVAGKEVESSIQRITQLARAAGIHLIVATQRPSVDVITGIIKANIPSRIAFAVSSGTDSRTILDHVGAERLLGNGDMLYMPIGENSPMRVQGVFVTDREVEQITSDVKKRAKPEYDDHFIMLEGVEGNSGIIGVSEDPMFEEIKEYVIEAQKASTSLLQRRFGIGYNRAARMIDALEEAGVIGPAQGSKPREVYLKKGE